MVGTGVKEYFIQFLEMEDYNVMIDGQNFFDQPVKWQLKKMITQPGVCYFIDISMNVIR